MRIEEKMLILPTLYIIKKRGSATTSDLIQELTLLFNPSGEDAKILAGRNDTKFSQKVRNLVSHRENNSMKIYTYFENGIYTLTEQGKNKLKEHLDELNYWFSNKFKYEDTLKMAIDISENKDNLKIYEEDIIITEGLLEKSTSKTRFRSRKLREYAMSYYSNKGKIKCEVCGFCFEDTYGDIGKNFIEIHHEKPICQYDKEDMEMFIKDAVKNVKPLCANCHRMVHRNTKEPITIDKLKEKIKPSN